MIYQGWLSRLIDKHLPDPLLPERWRRRINFLQRKGLEASADRKTYGVIAGSLRGGGGSGTTGGDGDRK